MNREFELEQLNWSYHYPECKCCGEKKEINVETGLCRECQAITEEKTIR